MNQFYILWNVLIAIFYLCLFRPWIRLLELSTTIALSARSPLPRFSASQSSGFKSSRSYLHTTHYILFHQTLFIFIHFQIPAPCPFNCYSTTIQLLGTALLPVNMLRPSIVLVTSVALLVSSVEGSLKCSLRDIQVNSNIKWQLFKEGGGRHLKEINIFNLFLFRAFLVISEARALSISPTCWWYPPGASSIAKLKILKLKSFKSNVILTPLIVK